MILGLALIVWLVMLGTDYYQTIKKLDAPMFARESIEVSNETNLIYQGIGYEIEMKKQADTEKLFSIQFRLFQKSIGEVEID